LFELIYASENFEKLLALTHTNTKEIREPYITVYH